jgi:hypothetical protein
MVSSCPPICRKVLQARGGPQEYEKSSTLIWQVTDTCPEPLTPLARSKHSSNPPERWLRDPNDSPDENSYPSSEADSDAEVTASDDASSAHSDEDTVLNFDITSLFNAYSQAFQVARARAEPGTLFSIHFEPTPWRTDLPPSRPWHFYKPHPDGTDNDGRLWPWLYLCDPTCDYGLCYATFGTPDACDLELCRWKHEIEWEDFRFLIMSGWLQLKRARIMLADWHAPTMPNMSDDVRNRMLAISVGLGEGPGPKMLKFGYPYLSPLPLPAS